MKKLVLTEQNGRVCRLTLNRPDKRNALSSEMMLLIGDAVNEASASGKIRALIVRGCDDRAFCAGGDLSQAAMDFDKLVEAIVYMQQSLQDFPFPSIAAVKGVAIGMGLDLATLCDIRIAGSNAFFSANAVKLGRVFHYTQAMRLIRLAGWGAATEMLLTGKIIDANQALQIGLVSEIYPNELLDEKASGLAESIGDADWAAVRETKIMLKSLIQQCVPP